MTLSGGHPEVLKVARLAHREADREAWRDAAQGSLSVVVETVSCSPSECVVRVRSSLHETDTTVIAWRAA